MSIQDILKKIPYCQFLYSLFINIWFTQTRMTKMVFNYNKKRFKRYSGAFNNSKARDLAYLTWLYHVIEKGLAMPNRRLGFGYEKVRILINYLNSIEKRYSIEDFAFITALSVLFKYLQVHVDNKYELPNDIVKNISLLQEKYPLILPLNQKKYTPNVFFQDVNKSFDIFSMSRHSVRHFSGELSVDKIINSIELAKYAPSACNRQPSKVHIVVDKEKIKQCLALQNGNRGFGYLGDKLLVITGDLSTVLGAQEFFDLNTNVGIFIMNLCYCLHFNKIAHCVLNWYALPKEDKKLRRILNIKENESIVAFVICGNLPDTFRVVSSPRNPVEDIYYIH